MRGADPRPRRRGPARPPRRPARPGRATRDCESSLRVASTTPQQGGSGLNSTNRARRGSAACARRRSVRGYAPSPRSARSRAPGAARRGQPAKRAVGVGQGRPQVELGAPHEQRELGLRRAPGQWAVGPGAAADRSRRRVAGRARRDGRKRGASAPGRPRSRPGRRPPCLRAPARQRSASRPGAPARDVGHRDQHGLAAREQVARDAGEALAAAVDGPGPAPLAPGRFAAAFRPRARRQPLPERALLAQHAQLAGAGRAHRAQQHARLDHAVPAVALEPQGDVVVVGRRPAPASAAASRRPRRGSGRRRGDQREARVLRSSPIAATCWKRAAGTSSVGCGLPMPNGRRRLELLGQLEAQRAARHDGVDALDRDQVRRARAPRRRGRRARGGRARRRPPRAPRRRPCGGRRSGSGARRRRPSPACRS